MTISHAIDTPPRGREAPPVVRLLPYQKAALARKARFTWSCWSRQTGKSFTFSLRRILRGLMRGRNQIILSAGERQSREVMEKVRMHCAAMRIWCEACAPGLFRNTAIRQLEARLPGNVRIIALPANPLTARGFTGDVFLDEFAMHRDDKAIWAALFPALLRGRGELDVASTPRGQRNMFHRLRSNTMFTHDTLTLAEAIRQGLDIDADEIRAAIGDEHAWRQEFCCEFVDESTSFMTYDLIRSCHDERLTTAIDWETLDRRDAEVYVGIDVGRHRDLTAVWLWKRRRAEAADAGPAHGSNGDGLAGAPPSSTSPPARDRAPRQTGHTARRRLGRPLPVPPVLVTLGVVVLQDTAFDAQERTIAGILEQPAVRRCCIDATGLGLHLAERLVQSFGDHRVEPVVFTPGLQRQLAGGLRVMAERGRLRIPPDDAIVSDWHSITRTVTGSGHLRFTADRSRGGHADRFWAAALGVHAADARGGEAGVMTSGPLTFARTGVW
ncbi:MAG: terminase large subunit domain-containing protein [Phycisphaerae bacterium]